MLCAATWPLGGTAPGLANEFELTTDGALRERGRCLERGVHEGPLAFEFREQLQELRIDIQKPALVELFKFLPVEAAHRIIQTALRNSPLH